MEKWRIIEFKDVKFGTTFRFEKQFCVRTGPFTFMDGRGTTHPAKYLPQDIHTLVAIESKNYNGS